MTACKLIRMLREDKIIKINEFNGLYSANEEITESAMFQGFERLALQNKSHL